MVIQVINFLLVLKKKKSLKGLKFGSSQAAGTMCYDWPLKGICVMNGI
jgi:hypothetical protein